MTSRIRLIVLLIVMHLFTSARARATDWPTWRHDATRSAATQTTLPTQLYLNWIMKLGPTRAAWPYEPRKWFDMSYEPIVKGKTLFVASPNEDSVTAYETETGRMKWRFYADGPVRFAPAARGDRIYFGSDDGFLYCLSADTGSVQWKFRAAPEGRPERWHMGNGRLISYWPVRGAPVVSDGRVYFASGLWPTLGIVVGALDAVTGKPVWLNAQTGSIQNVRVDHNLTRNVGLSPQGYLVVSDKRLLVPNGRSMPAAFDCKTGRLLWYRQGYRHGYWRVAATTKYIFVGPDGVLNAETGREVGSRYDELLAGGGAVRAAHDTFECSIFPYKLFPGCTAQSALARNMVYSMVDGVFYAHDLNRVNRTLYDRKLYGAKTYKPMRWDVQERW